MTKAEMLKELHSKAARREDCFEAGIEFALLHMRIEFALLHMRSETTAESLPIDSKMEKLLIENKMLRKDVSKNMKDSIESKNQNQHLKDENERLKFHNITALEIAKRFADERDELRAKVQELENERDQWND